MAARYRPARDRPERKQDAAGLDPACYRSVASPPMSIQRLGIVGSGIMGSGIAEVAAKAGAEVVLRSRTQESAAAMVAALERPPAKPVERGQAARQRAGEGKSGSVREDLGGRVLIHKQRPT